MKILVYIFALFFLFSAGTAQAQSGCSDSPECATPILAIVGAAGILASRWLKK